MLDFIRMFLSRSWEFFNIRWPGFEFTIGQAFLAVFASAAALRAVLKMAGVSSVLPSLSPVRSFISSGGNNKAVKVSEARKGDTK